MTMAGLTADGRGLTNFMRTEALNHEVSLVFRRFSASKIVF